MPTREPFVGMPFGQPLLGRDEVRREPDAVVHERHRLQLADRAEEPRPVVLLLVSQAVEQTTKMSP